MGLVKRSEPGHAVSDALAYAQEIADNCSPLAMAVSKQQLWGTLREPLEASRVAALTLWRTLREHGDFKEGISSYIERRPPAFAPIGAEDVNRVEELLDRTLGRVS